MEHKKYKYLVSKTDIKEFLENFDVFVCDCDGVFWRGNVVFENIKETMEYLMLKLKKRMYFATNNSTNSRKMYVKKFEKKVGIKIDYDNIYPSSYLLAEYLKSKNFKKKAYVCGMEGIKIELDLAGISSCGYSEHYLKEYNEQSFVDTVEIDNSIGCVVGSYDSKFSNYKIAYAQAQFLNNDGCLFLATNTDSTFPMVSKNGKNVIVPGGGTYVSALATCFQKDPVIVGKPSTFGIELIMKKYNLRKDRVCYIGDRLNTDIRMANKAGIASLLVLTGISKREEVDCSCTPTLEIPTFVINKFSNLLEN